MKIIKKDLTKYSIRNKILFLPGTPPGRYQIRLLLQVPAFRSTPLLSENYMVYKSHNYLLVSYKFGRLKIFIEYLAVIDKYDKNVHSLSKNKNERKS